MNTCSGPLSTEKSASPLLQMVNISKTYPGVTALRNVSFQLSSGEVHCVVGENGAGKSTLMKILAGAESPDEGQIYINGYQFFLQNPVDAQRAGIGVIYQDFKLVPYLSVAENILIGHLPKKNPFPIIDWPAMRRRATKLLSMLGETLPLDQKVGELSAAQQQMLEIAKVLNHDARIIAMDEPSAALSDRELANLFHIIQQLRNQHVGIIYISHRLEEVEEIGDRITILRDGRNIHTCQVAMLDRPTIVRYMVGREIDEEYPQVQHTLGEVVLQVENLRRKTAVQNVSFEVRRGEIFCLAGLVGSGRTELARLIFAADPRDDGRIMLNGKEINPNSPRDAIELGIGLLTEDRNRQGLIMRLSVQDNIILSKLVELRRGLTIDWKKAEVVSEKFIDGLRIKTPSPRQKVMYLSGGNRQKVVLARWLFTEAKLLIFDEPTQGIDVGVKREIYQLLHHLVERGIAVVVISSDLTEVLRLGDRIGVMREGRLVGILNRDECTQEKVMELSTGA